MAASTETRHITKGGEFLIRETEAADIFIPEQFNEEQKLIGSTANDFLQHDVIPNIEKLDEHEPGLMQHLIQKAGELGLLGMSIPEQYGGFGKDFVTGTYVTELLGAGHSFSVAMAAHTGIGTLPILYFGTEEQKQKYLPKLAVGELKASYCLTEPGSGSDALGAKTTAMYTADKKQLIINGQKMWITNGGFADVFIVFAKIDGDKFTGIIVDANTPGVTRGEEEKKMGIKGSSTRQIFFQDAKVPVENILGEIGKGHLIAFNILNIGRLKLAAAALGASKRVTTMSIEYAVQREQFKQSISNFGAIKHKIAEEAIQVFACESAIYRTANDIENHKAELLSAGKSYEEALMGAAEEYAIECALLKILGSEVLDFCVDENVQIHGGIGFSEEYPAARAYRDSRINRIFEGTNEINRLLSVDMLLKRAMKGRIDLMSPAMAVQKELMSVPDFGDEEGIFSTEKKVIKSMKKGVLMIAGAAVQKLMMKLDTEQELLMNVSDMMLDIFTCESLLLRVEKMIRMKSENECVLQIDILKTYLNDAVSRFTFNGKTAIASFAEGDEARMMNLGLKRFTKLETINTKDARRRIAAKLIEEKRYCF
jgi:alkylation response protein AidB-like acyl-CoA dehydrogenase